MDNTLATNIRKVNELGRLKFDYSRIANKNENLLSILKANNAKYQTRVNLAKMKASLKDPNYQMKNS